MCSSDTIVSPTRAASTRASSARLIVDLLDDRFDNPVRAGQIDARSVVEATQLGSVRRHPAVKNGSGLSARSALQPVTRDVSA